MKRRDTQNKSQNYDASPHASGSKAAQVTPRKQNSDAPYFTETASNFETTKDNNYLSDESSFEELMDVLSQFSANPASAANVDVNSVDLKDFRADARKTR